MKNQTAINRLFTESLQPVVNNGQTPRHFKRAVLSKVDTTGLIEALRNNTEVPGEVGLGDYVVVSDARGVSLRKTGHSTVFYMPVV
jgi:hypothetical protein